MLKVIFIVECDTCREPFERIATSTDRNPATWDYLLADLEARALNCYWSGPLVHCCASCLDDVSSNSEQTVDNFALAHDDDF